jgi:uncharacterized protein YndB with AHSA1/START domain
VNVTREVLVDASVGDVWRALTDSEELSAWFGGSVTIDPRVGGAASFVEAGARRSAVVEEVEDGRRLAFRWWSDDDPDAVSSVVFAVEEVGGATRVVVTETAPVTAPAASCAVGEASLHWADRLVGLELRFLRSAALVPA